MSILNLIVLCMQLSRVDTCVSGLAGLHYTIHVCLFWSQCFNARLSTLTTLLNFEQDTKLSEVLQQSMARNKLDPVLTQAHLTALDRRVRIMLRTDSQCVEEKRNYQLVIIDDGHKVKVVIESMSLSHWHRVTGLLTSLILDSRSQGYWPPGTGSLT